VGLRILKRPIYCTDCKDLAKIDMLNPEPGRRGYFSREAGASRFGSLIPLHEGPENDIVRELEGPAVLDFESLLR